MEWDLFLEKSYEISLKKFELNIKSFSKSNEEIKKYILANYIIPLSYNSYLYAKSANIEKKQIDDLLKKHFSEYLFETIYKLRKIKNKSNTTFILILRIILIVCLIFLLTYSFKGREKFNVRLEPTNATQFNSYSKKVEVNKSAINREDNKELSNVDDSFATDEKDIAKAIIIKQNNKVNQNLIKKEKKNTSIPMINKLRKNKELSSKLEVEKKKIIKWQYLSLSACLLLMIFITPRLFKPANCFSESQYAQIKSKICLLLINAISSYKYDLSILQSGNF